MSAHPSVSSKSDLLRQLVAVSLLSFSDSSKGVNGSANIGAYIHASIESNGPDIKTIIDSTRLLERIGNLTSFKVIFDSMPGTLNESSRNNYQDDYIEAEDGEKNGMTVLSPSKVLSNRMSRCKDIWQVFALDDLMMTGSKRTKGRNAHQINRRTTLQDQREGEESLLCRKEYDRESVWRLADVLVKGWREEIRHLQTDPDKAARSSHLARQFDDEKRNENRTKRPSENIGEAFDFIFAGMMPTSLIRSGKEEGKSAKQKLAERSKRGKIASGLLIELYNLAKMGFLDRQAILRATSELIAKCDRFAKGMLCEAMKLEGCQFELAEAVIMCLGLTAEEEIEEDQKNRKVLQGYQAYIETLCQDDLMPREVGVLLDAIADSDWIYLTAKQGIERAMVQAQDGRSINEITILCKQPNVKSLLNEKWSMSTEKNETRDSSKFKATKAKLTWEQLSFAASWKRASMRASLERFQLKIEVIRMIKDLARFASANKKSQKALQGLTKLCLTELERLGKVEIAGMRKCCEEMNLLYEEMKKGGIGADEDDDERTQRRAMSLHSAACFSQCEEMANEVTLVELTLAMSS